MIDPHGRQRGKRGMAFDGGGTRVDRINVVADGGKKCGRTDCRTFADRGWNQ